MATPLTHIILTDKIYHEYFDYYDKKDFFLGTLLPDIRYISPTLSREHTHKKNITLADVLAVSDSFEAGMLFHSLVDTLRDTFYIQKNLYTPGHNEDFILAVKLLEDQYLFDKVTNRTEYIDMMKDIPYTTIAHLLGIDAATLNIWYDMIQKSIPPAGPNDLSRRTFETGLGLPESYSTTINELIHTLEKDPHILQLINEFYKSFGSLLSL